MTTYVETDCTFTHEGRTVESGGAAVTPDNAVAYFKRDDTGCSVTNWHGQKLGAARIIATWSTPRSYVSNCMHQVEATINGVVYTGRTAGNNMLWQGKRKANQ